MVEKKKLNNNNNTKEQSSEPKKTGSSLVANPMVKSVMVSKQGNEKIVALAAQIAKESKAYNDWVWLAAEAELKIQLKTKPSEKEIRSAAEQLFQKHLSIENLQLKIAENRINGK